MQYEQNMREIMAIFLRFSAPTGGITARAMRSSAFQMA